MRGLFTTLPFLYMGLIWFLSSHPSDAIVETPFSFDDLLKESLHLVEFGILYWLFIFMLACHGKLSQKASMIVAVISIFYGITDEVHQAFVPSRSATFIDFVKDTIGVWVSFFLVRKWYFEKKTSRLRNFLDGLSKN
ncbi:VanZ family protein [Bacillus sp. FJAT-47783]|uniref:VanZ family protein n=1 Tax=Bacillus sp. FJAT-47783 TaxID=2922712 RepID=UPI001FAC9BCF|nr:VanZ family protein [Bacillus sp. FJAT-47783]